MVMEEGSSDTEASMDYIVTCWEKRKGEGMSEGRNVWNGREGERKEKREEGGRATSTKESWRIPCSGLRK